jgi:hypothetical protein
MTAAPKATLALSLITAHHEQLIGQLIAQFGIHAIKAYQLVVTKKERVVLQLEAWPFRDVRPRNLAGWIIQAIEGNYKVPPWYLEHKRKQKKRELLEATETVRSACPSAAVPDSEISKPHNITRRAKFVFTASPSEK